MIHVETSPSQSGGRVDRADARACPTSRSIRGSAQTGTSCRQRTSGPSAVASSTIAAGSPSGAAGGRSRGRRSTCGRGVARGRGYGYRRYGLPDARRARRSSRLHAAVRPRARRRARPAGAHVELVTSPFRFGARPAADGYGSRSPSTGARAGSTAGRLRLAREGASSTRARCAASMRRHADVLHLQWLAAPEVDRRCSATRTPLVFTAHDLLPRRTARRTTLWRRLFGRFDRVVVHSERGRATLDAFGVPPDRLRVDPAPRLPERPPPRDDGRTVSRSA